MRTPSRLMFCPLAACLASSVAAAVTPAAALQAPLPATTGCPAPQGAFGSTDKADVSIEGKVYFLPKEPNDWSVTLKDFDSIPSQGSIFTDKWDIPQRNFTTGFPGVSDRFEWFAIDYQGSIYVPTAGKYSFRLNSDDGSTLSLDGAIVIDNDRVHAMLPKSGAATLTLGTHAFRLRYFQGPASRIGLELYVTPPGGREKIFTLQDFNQWVLNSRRLLGVTEDSKAVHIRFGSEVLFDTGKYGLRPDATSSLAELATLLRGSPGPPITIEGHTDNVGTPASNQRLSEARADAVKQWLVANARIPAGCIATKGYGLTKPVATNATVAGRQKNRRVEVSIAKSGQ